MPPSSHLDDEDSDLDSRDCQARQSNQESRTKSLDGSDSQGGAEVNVGSKCVHNGQVSAIYSNGTEKSETHIDTLEPASTGAPFPGKKALPYTNNVVNDSSPITLSNEGLDGTNEVETTKGLSERVDRGTTQSSSKGKCETELRNSFFLSNYSGYGVIYANVGYIRDPLKQDLVLELFRKQNRKTVF